VPPVTLCVHYCRSRRPRRAQAGADRLHRSRPLRPHGGLGQSATATCRGHLDTAKGRLAVAVPQVHEAGQPYRSAFYDFLRGHSNVVQTLAVEMYASGSMYASRSRRATEAAFTDATGSASFRNLRSVSLQFTCTWRLPVQARSSVVVHRCLTDLLYLYSERTASRVSALRVTRNQVRAVRCDFTQSGRHSRPQGRPGLTRWQRGGRVHGELGCGHRVQDPGQDRKLIAHGRLLLVAVS